MVSSGGSGQSAAELASLLAGEYNNHAQVWRISQEGGEAPPFYELVIQLLPADRAGGEALLYRQYRQDGELYREARLLLAEEDGGVTQTVQARSAQGWQTLPGCEVRWHRGTSGFEGSTSGDGCRFGRRDGGEVVVYERRWNASAETLHLEEVTRRVGSEERHAYDFSQLHYYRGWAGVLPEGPASKGDADWRLDRELRMNDGGDAVAIEGPDGPTGYAVRLERLVWPRSGIPMLRLSVLEADSGSLIAYSWSQPDARRIGLNLGWLQAGLEAEPGTGSPGRSIP